MLIGANSGQRFDAALSEQQALHDCCPTHEAVRDTEPPRPVGRGAQGAQGVQPAEEHMS